MFDRHLSRRALRIGARTAAFLAAMIVWGPPQTSEAARRENPICVNAYKQGRLLQRASRLHQAKEAMLRCTRINCSAALRKECQFVVEKLEQDAPTVVLEVTDNRGNPVTNVRVVMDGRPLVSRIDGRALPVDPGFHEFIFENAGVIFAKEKAVVLQGQRNRPVSATLVWQRKAGDPVEEKASLPPPRRRLIASAPPPEPPPPPPPPVQTRRGRIQAPPSAALAKAAAVEETEAEVEAAVAPEDAEALALEDLVEETPAARRSSRAARDPESSVSSRATTGRAFSTTSYLLAGTAVAGLGTAGFLTYWGRTDNKKLASTCAPMCDPSSVNHVKKLYLGASVAAGLGAVALAGWVYHVMFSSPPRREALPETASGTPPAGVDYGFELQPMPSGGFAGVSGRF